MLCNIPHREQRREAGGLTVFGKFAWRVRWRLGVAASMSRKERRARWWKRDPRPNGFRGWNAECKKSGSFRSSLTMLNRKERPPNPETQPLLRNQEPFVLLGVSLYPTPALSMAGWPAGTNDQPGSASPALGLQGHVHVWLFLYMWVQGI